MSFPLRYQLALALVGLNIVGTAAVAGFAYRASRRTLETQAVRAVAVVAQEREITLVQLLQRRQERMDAFLASTESLCAERGPKGTFGWENECVRVALSGFQTAERATGAELRYADRPLAAGGDWKGLANVTPAPQLATISTSAGRGEYTMQAVRERLTLRVRVALDDIDALFQDRSGLEANGEVFLADADGRLLTHTRYPVPAGQSVLDGPVRSCLSGATGDALAPDYRGTAVMSGFRPVPAIGGGCIVANVQYADALVPIQRLGRLFAFASMGFVLAGAVVSLVVARAVTKPIARLAASARALEAGQFGQPVPVAGPSEVRQLARALSSMAQSVGSLVQREHDARLAAEAANRTKDDFLAMVSHELRTPLNAILGWAAIMLNHQGDEAVATKALHAVERSARTQARLIDELLDVSRIVSGRLRLSPPVPVSMGTIIDAALEAVRPSADAKSLDIQKRFSDEGMVVGDPDRLQQVVGNLLSNAVRFTSDGGRIEVTMDTTADAVEVRVADNGMGIPPAFLPHVFERFRQVDSSTTRTHGGLGLGLAIARHLVELHGGSVRAESPGPGLGATFTVRLARSDAPAPAARPLPPASAPFPPAFLAGVRVLLVDDDAETRQVLCAILEEAGASTTAVASAEETRAFLEHEPADLLIADIGMPKEDGYALMRSVRALASASRSRIPAIALTAHARREDVAKALESGFQMHVAKPVDFSRLLSAVAATLGHATA
ncbi:MAG: ATP-binding protein [Acidobacteriota bacterium]